MEQADRPAGTTRAFRFGVYEVDLAARELRKNGLKVSLQEQPFRVLSLLLAQPGQLLTREELQQQLWMGDVAVDSELGLNTAIKKIRIALDDSADNPRFVETLPKRGYRFIAPVQEIGRNGNGILHVEESSSTAATTAANFASTETAVAHQEDLLAEQAELTERGRNGSTSPIPQQDPGFAKSTTIPAERQDKKRSRYLMLVLVLLAAGLSVLAQQMITRKLLGSIGLAKKNGAVSVFRAVPNAGQPAPGIGGYDLKAPNDRAFVFDYDHSGKLDHLVFYRPGTGVICVLKNSAGTFSSDYRGDGVGGFDLKNPKDRAFAFDYEHSGKLDYLVLYRSGSEMMSILKNEGDGIFSPVYTHSQSEPAFGTASDDHKIVPDRVFAFDYDHSGKLDYLFLYESDTNTICILKNSGGAFTPVYVHSGPGGATRARDLNSPADDMFAFDYDHSGKLDHLVFYRPGSGTISILKNSGGSFSPVYEGDGIGGYDLKSPADRVFAFDYEQIGKLDHLVLYRPGTGITRILKNVGGTFSPVYAGKGIGGYDLVGPNDQGIAFDYDHSGKLDHLAFYRPGAGTICISYFPQ